MRNESKNRTVPYIFTRELTERLFDQFSVPVLYCLPCRVCLFQVKLLVNEMQIQICSLFIMPLGTLTLVAKTLFCPDLCSSEESDEKLSKSKNDSAGKLLCCLI